MARGFALLDPKRRKEIASRGGKAAHAKGTAYEWDSESASRAGKKGGMVISADRDHMSKIGRRGGAATAKLGRSNPLRKVSIREAADSIGTQN